MIIYFKDIMWAIYIVFFLRIHVLRKKNVTENHKNKILYFYDTKGWSYHNVGRAWLEERHDVEVDFQEYSTFSLDEIIKYDQVWYNTPSMYFKYPFFIENSVFVIHGSNELLTRGFKSRLKDHFVFFINPFFWASIKQNIKLLKKAKKIISISEEITNILLDKGIGSSLVSTVSLLPQRNEKELATKKCSFISVCAVNKAKNINLLKRLQKYCTRKKIDFRLIIKDGSYILPDEDYIASLSDREVYVSTSFKEGGPIPAMDAMMRGCVVLTTPVGQMLEIIKDGENGFFCRTEADFKEKINLLANDLDLLQRMRVNSLKTISTLRNKDIIAKQIENFLKVAS